MPNGLRNERSTYKSTPCKACNNHIKESFFTENTIKNSTVELPLPTDDIMDLLNLCLTSTYFQYNGKHYKQLHSTAMGSPVSVVVAETVMQNHRQTTLC